MEVLRKKKFRVLSDLVAIGGASVLGVPLPPLALYGLWLNRHRVHLQRAAPFADATRAAQGNAKLPARWFDALEEWEEEGAAARREFNNDISERQIVRQARRR